MCSAVIVLPHQDRYISEMRNCLQRSPSNLRDPAVMITPHRNRHAIEMRYSSTMMPTDFHVFSGDSSIKVGIATLWRCATLCNGPPPTFMCPAIMVLW